MIIKKAELKETVYVPNKIVLDDKPKFAFIGRSNVGKSSLINFLCNRKRMAKTSSTPGKTLSINYYEINDSFYFVDLPGYGYAKTCKKEASRVMGLCNAFFAKTLKPFVLFLLIDSRRGFMEQDKLILKSLMDSDIKILTVLTKSDKVKNSYLENLLKSLYEDYQLRAYPFNIKSLARKSELLTLLSQSIKEL